MGRFAKDKPEKCPFKVGDVVVYRPSEHGWGWGEVMSPLSEGLVPGREYVVAEIQQNLYVVVEGYKHPGGGLFWTEFEIQTSGEISVPKSTAH